MELKLGCGVWGVWISWGIVGNGYGRDMGGGTPGVYGNFWEISEKFPGNFQELWGMSKIFNMILLSGKTKF